MLSFHMYNPFANAGEDTSKAEIRFIEDREDSERPTLPIYTSSSSSSSKDLDYGSLFKGIGSGIGDIITSATSAARGSSKSPIITVERSVSSPKSETDNISKYFPYLLAGALGLVLITRK